MPNYKIILYSEAVEQGCEMIAGTTTDQRLVVV